MPDDSYKEIDDPAATELPQSTTDSPADGSVERVGSYRLLQKVGEGGMGEVFEAEQVEPVRRRVALKVIKQGMDTKQVVARFEAERQALAMMDHPCVAKVFEAGSTPRGRPYFVMEFVRGVPITEHCDRHRLSNLKRLELFMQVCGGVQHAHQKGIIHRDLKPSNVLVSIHEGRAVPKIIDFGVAKATSQKLTERTMFTALGVLVGTPEYMSPEQAEMTGQNIDTRSDVYSLGVMLYELLVGVLPFDPQELRSAGFDDLRRKIREEDPPRPSTRASSLGDRSTESANRRRVDSSTLRRQLRGDLDWITMKALDKDRTRRYGSPQELAADIERFLTDQPVLASPPSGVYLMRKFVRRHKVGVAAAIVGALVVLVFAGAMALQAGRIARERDQVKLEAETATQVSDFLVGLFKVADPSEALGNTITARELLDKGAERIRLELVDQPLVQARLMDTMGRVYLSLYVLDEAGPLLEQALEIRERELGPDSVEVAESLEALGGLRCIERRFEEARPLMDRALTIREVTLGPDHVDTGWSVWHRGNCANIEGKSAEAQADLQRALSIFQQRPGGDLLGVSWSLNNLGMVAGQQGDLKSALSYFERALEAKLELMPREHPDISIALGNVGYTLQQLGRYEQAQPYNEEAVAISRKTLGESNPGTLRVIYNLAGLAALQGDRDRAIELLRQAIKPGVRGAHGEADPSPSEDPDFASLHDDPEFQSLVAEYERLMREE